MTTLLVGFDSAWTPTNSGALVGVLCSDDGAFQELCSPLVVNYVQSDSSSNRMPTIMAPTLWWRSTGGGAECA